MSVIIPGVELPENCLECWFIRKDSVWIDEATYEYIYRCLIRQTRYDDEDDEDDEDVWFSFKEATKCRHECCPLRTHLDLPTSPLLVKRMNLKKQTTTAGESVSISSISYAHGEAEFSDLVHVVRCKYCENWDRSWVCGYGSEGHYCPNIDLVTDADFFCGDGERKDG